MSYPTGIVSFGEKAMLVKRRVMNV